MLTIDFEKIFISSPLPIYIIQDGFFRAVNPNTAQITGYTMEELLQIPFHKLIHPEDLSRVLNNSVRRFAGKKVDESYEFRAINRRGEVLYLKGFFSLIEFNGRPAILGQLMDITQQKKTERVFREIEEKYRTMIELANEAILVAQNGMIKFANPKALEIVGYSKEIITSSPFVNFIYPADRDMVMEKHLNRAKGDELPHIYSFRVVDKAGNIRWLENNSVTLTWEGKPASLGYLNDITERKRAEERLRLSESRLETLLKLNQMTGLSLKEIADFALEEGVRLTGSKIGYLAFVNEDESLLTMNFWSKGAIAKCAIRDKPLLCPIEKAGLWGEAVRQRKPIITNDHTAPNNLKRGLPEGHVYLKRHMNVPVFDGDRIVMVVGVGNKKENYSESDVSQLTLLMSGMWRIVQRKKAEEALQESELRLRRITVNMLDMISQTVEGIFQYISPSCKSVLGYEPEDLLGKSIFDLVHPDDFDKAMAAYQSEISTSSTGRLEFRYLHAKGHYLWLETIVSPLFGDNGKVTEAIWCTRDMTERKQAEEQLKYLSLHDSLTGLYNRAYFEQEMRRLEGGRHTPVGIILCDVDGLKLVNDTLGHNTGDNLLMETARALKESFREGDVVARIGGDEFAILLPNSEKISVENSVRRIRRTFEEYNAKNPKLPLSISIGFAISDEAYINMGDLFKEADNNMYREKLHRSQSARSAIVQTLMKALEIRDFITEGHADRLQDLVANLALALGMPESKVTDLRLLAQFHDIGKVGIPDRILFKPGPLTSEEMIEMQQHCEIGHRISKSAPDLSPLADWILKHHEWWNGEGYPLGLKGEEIPLECRILAIADAYDAMTSDRPYRKALSHKEAVSELKRCARTQFNPELVSLFIRVLDEQGFK